MKVNVNTKIDDDTIKQQIIMDDFEDMHQRFCEQIVNLQDEGIRNSLIKLGWTPPECSIPNLKPKDIYEMFGEVRYSTSNAVIYDDFKGKENYIKHYLLSSLIDGLIDTDLDIDVEKKDRYGHKKYRIDLVVMPYKKFVKVIKEIVDKVNRG